MFLIKKINRDKIYPIQNGDKINELSQDYFASWSDEYDWTSLCTSFMLRRSHSYPAGTEF